MIKMDFTRMQYHSISQGFYAVIKALVTRLDERGVSRTRTEKPIFTQALYNFFSMSNHDQKWISQKDTVSFNFSRFLYCHQGIRELDKGVSRTRHRIANIYQTLYNFAVCLIMIKWISQNYSIIQFLKVSMLSSMHL
jgi:hypothetical protein